MDLPSITTRVTPPRLPHQHVRERDIWRARVVSSRSITPANTTALAQNPYGVLGNRWCIPFRLSCDEENMSLEVVRAKLRCPDCARSHLIADLLTCTRGGRHVRDRRARLRSRRWAKPGRRRGSYAPRL